MAMASAVAVSAACIGDDMLLHGISADGGVGNIRERSRALGPAINHKSTPYNTTLLVKSANNVLGRK